MDYPSVFCAQDCAPNPTANVSDEETCVCWLNRVLALLVYAESRRGARQNIDDV
jgi:hypothetical protein